MTKFIVLYVVLFGVILFADNIPIDAIVKGKTTDSVVLQCNGAVNANHILLVSLSTAELGECLAEVNVQANCYTDRFTTELKGMRCRKNDGKTEKYILSGWLIQSDMKGLDTKRVAKRYPILPRKSLNDEDSLASKPDAPVDIVITSIVPVDDDR